MSTPIRIVVGTGNRHKFQEISAILSDLKQITLQSLADFPNVPPVDESAKTFEGNASKKAVEFARFLRLARNVVVANQSTAADDDETDFDKIAAQRARSSQRMKPVRLGSSSTRLPAVKPLAEHDVLVMADDSGLEVDALDGAPGVISAHYAGKHGDDAANNTLLLKNLKGVPTEKRKARFVCVIALASPDGVLFTARGTVEGRVLTEAAGKGGFGYDPLFFYPPLNKSFGELSAAEKNKLSHRAQALTKFRAELQKLMGA